MNDEVYDAHIESEIPKLRCVCAWCDALIHEATPGFENDGLSHGVCSKCLPSVRKQFLRAAQREKASA